MEINIFNQQKSIFNRFLAEIRDTSIQTDPLRFRRNMERMGEIFAYEISKTLPYSRVEIKTPLGTAVEELPYADIVVASLLRAGLPLHHGLLNFFDRAGNAFISAYRVHNDEGEIEIKVDYISSPALDGKIVILSDPMLASGSSMELAYHGLLQRGKPAYVHIVSVVSSKAGLDYIVNAFKDEPVTIWMGAVDEELNSKSYIVPGIGDAGDLAFGTKL